MSGAFSQLLTREFAQRRQANPRYSLRAFAALLLQAHLVLESRFVQAHLVLDKTPFGLWRR